MNQCSVNHVFLTGKKQIGKSTFLKKVLAVYPKCPAGFYTVRTNAFWKLPILSIFFLQNCRKTKDSHRRKSSFPMWKSCL